MLDANIFSTDTNVELDYTIQNASGVAVDVSAATQKKFEIVSPDGTLNTYDAGFVTDGSDGKLKYVVSSFGQVGIWKYRAYVQIAGGLYHGTWLEFYAQEPSPIDATWGGASANCYIAITAANSFVMSAVVDNSAWSEATPQQRCAALLEATRDIDSYEYLGCRYYEDQALLFPREVIGKWPWNRTTGATNSYSIEQHRMQVAVEQATCFQALAILRDDGRNVHQERIRNGVRSFRQQTGEAEEEYVYNFAGSSSRLSPEVTNRLKAYRAQKTCYRG